MLVDCVNGHVQSGRLIEKTGTVAECLDFPPKVRTVNLSVQNLYRTQTNIYILLRVTNIILSCLTFSTAVGFLSL